MKIKWSIGKQDISKVKALIELQNKYPDMEKAIQERKERNVDTRCIPAFSKDRFWKAIIEALLSTQQRSGPNSPIARFCNEASFPLTLRECSSKSALADFVTKSLSEFGGIRFKNRIGDFIGCILQWLSTEGWVSIKKLHDELKIWRSKQPDTNAIGAERKAARFVDETKQLKGFGPKQSRNLWQALGLFRYEIPLDSRITKWINSNNIFPFKLSTSALQDRNYYEFVMTGIQELCARCNVLPCILDAAIFSSYDLKELDGKRSS